MSAQHPGLINPQPLQLLQHLSSMQTMAAELAPAHLAAQAVCVVMGPFDGQQAEVLAAIAAHQVVGDNIRAPQRCCCLPVQQTLKHVQPEW